MAGRAEEVFVPAEGEPVPVKPVVRSVDGVLNITLRLGPVHLSGLSLSLLARAYNGSVPGPTLSMHPGDRLIIRLENALSEPLGPAAHNSYQHPNRTNLHVHGLHVSPLMGSDNVLDVVVDPGESFVYEYHLPPQHSPGIYWAHPHGHGSLTSQTGAALAMLVEDPKGYMSPQVAAMGDHILVLQNFPRGELEMAANKSEDRYFRVERWNLQEDLWLVNGAPKPVLTVEAGVWVRLRLVMSGIASWLSLSFGSCKVALLAKDGIYLEDFPRYVKRVQLFPGSRAQLLLNCPAGEEHVISSPVPDAIKGSFDVALGPNGAPLELFTIRSAGASLSAPILTPWSPAFRPAYLQDLQGRRLTPKCSCSTSMGNGVLAHGKRWIGGHDFQGPKAYLTHWPQNFVAERLLSGVDRHPFHQHTWPFQLAEMPLGKDSYFKAGDWHDTYSNVLDPDVLVRFSTVRFSGALVIHCHANTHSDEGMLGVELVSQQACGCGLLDDPLKIRHIPYALLTAISIASAALIFITALLAKRYRSGRLKETEMSESSEEDSCSPLESSN